MENKLLKDEIDRLEQVEYRYEALLDVLKEFGDYSFYVEQMNRKLDEDKLEQSSGIGTEDCYHYNEARTPWCKV